MSLKSLLPAAAAVAVATLALAGCSMTTNVSGGDSSAPTSSSSEGPDHSGHDHSDKSDSSDKWLFIIEGVGVVCGVGRVVAG